MEGAEEILLDMNALAEGHKYLGLGAYAAATTPTGWPTRLDSTGYRRSILHVKDLRKDRSRPNDRAGRIGRWATDNKTHPLHDRGRGVEASDKGLATPSAGRASDLSRRRDELFDVGAAGSLDKKVIFLAGAKTSRRVRYLPADAPAAAPRVDSCRARRATSTTSITTTASLLHHDQQGRQELQGGHSADRRPVGEELEAVHRPQSGDVGSAALTFFANHLVVSEREGGLSISA